MLAVTVDPEMLGKCCRGGGSTAHHATPRALPPPSSLFPTLSLRVSGAKAKAASASADVTRVTVPASRQPLVLRVSRGVTVGDEWREEFELE